MLELFLIYKYAFFLCPLASGVLCLMGAHLVSRNESLQLMALSQAALAGNIFGYLIFEEGRYVQLAIFLGFFRFS